MHDLEAVQGSLKLRFSELRDSAVGRGLAFERQALGFRSKFGP